MAAGLPAAAAAAAPGMIGLPANNSPAKGEYLKDKKIVKLLIFWITIVLDSRSDL